MNAPRVNVGDVPLDGAGPQVLRQPVRLRIRRLVDGGQDSPFDAINIWLTNAEPGLGGEA